MLIDSSPKDRDSPCRRCRASNRGTTVTVAAFAAILVAWAVFAALLVLQLVR